MTRVKSNLLLVFTIFIFHTSCDAIECRNNNPTFSKFSPDESAYKKELAKQIQSIGADKLSYSFNGYSKKDGKEFILVDIQGTGLCAMGEIQVND